MLVLPQPDPDSELIEPQLVAHPPPTRRACQYSSTVPAAGSMIVITPSLPVLGTALVGIGRGVAASGQGPQLVIVQVTCWRGVNGDAT